ncbi:hypothetical protein [Streptomyces sp. NPDC093097]|uniref:hypothetical protein n=1 Tax=Streptomyces sp. NPDC093097 TaxID=3366027 RepID=UPI003817A78B
MERTDRAISPGVPHAEAGEIWPRDGYIGVHGHCVGAEREPCTVVVRARAPQEAELRFPAEVGDGGFAVRIPLGELAAACTGAEQTWDLYVSVPGRAAELRLGRHLDDIVGKKKIFTYPAQCAAGWWIEPFYTVKDNVSIGCRRADHEGQDGR